MLVITRPPVTATDHVDVVIDAAFQVAEYAEAISESPGVAATLLTVAVEQYALGQPEPREALETQIAYLQRALERIR